MNGNDRVWPGWRSGEFQAHFIHTGVAESVFFVFPDSTGGVTCQSSSMKPSQATFVLWRGAFEHLSISDSTFFGHSDEVGIYLLDSDLNSMTTCSFSGLGTNVLEESLP